MWVEFGLGTAGDMATSAFIDFRVGSLAEALDEFHEEFRKILGKQKNYLYGKWRAR